MKRRTLLALGVGGMTTVAGCGDVLSNDPQPAQDREPTPSLTQTPEPTRVERPTPADLDSEERDFLLNAFRLELIRSGIAVEDLDEDGTVGLEYVTSAPSEAGVLDETLTIAQAFYGELLNQGFYPDFLQVWVRDPETQNSFRVYDIQPEWVIEWLSNEITTAQFLAKIDETVEEL